MLKFTSKSTKKLIITAALLLANSFGNESHQEINFANEFPLEANLTTSDKIHSIDFLVASDLSHLTKANDKKNLLKKLMKMERDESSTESENVLRINKPNIWTDIISTSIDYPNNSLRIKVYVVQFNGHDLDSLWLNGKSTKISGGAAKRNMEVILQPGENEFEIIASNKLGLESAYTIIINYSDFIYDGDEVVKSENRDVANNYNHYDVDLIGSDN